MSVVLVLLCALFISSIVKGQSGLSKCVEKFDSTALKNVYVIVDQWPEFPGGKDVMEIFIKKNLKYPKECIEGNVYVSFIVEADGQLTNWRVLRSITKSSDSTALSVIKKMPKWKPGKCKNAPVPVIMNIPIGFRL